MQEGSLTRRYSPGRSGSYLIAGVVLDTDYNGAGGGGAVVCSHCLDSNSEYVFAFPLHSASVNHHLRLTIPYPPSGNSIQHGFPSRSSLQRKWSVAGAMLTDEIHWSFPVPHHPEELT